MMHSHSIPQLREKPSLCNGQRVRRTISYPKPLDHIVNKRLRKYVSEINALRFTYFHIAGAKSYLSDRGSKFPSGGAGDDRGESP